MPSLHAPVWAHGCECQCLPHPLLTHRLIPGVGRQLAEHARDEHSDGIVRRPPRYLRAQRVKHERGGGGPRGIYAHSDEHAIVHTRSAEEVRWRRGRARRPLTGTTGSGLAARRWACQRGRRLLNSRSSRRCPRRTLQKGTRDYTITTRPSDVLPRTRTTTN